MKKVLFSLLAFTLIFAACSKSDNGGSKKDNLTQGHWKMTEGKLVYAFGTESFYDSLQSCEKDNYFVFNADGSITVDEGTTKCNATDPQSSTDGAWALSSSDSKISIAGNSTFPAMTMDITTLDKMTLKLKKDTSMSIPPLGTITGTIYVSFTNIK